MGKSTYYSDKPKTTESPSNDEMIKTTLDKNKRGTRQAEKRRDTEGGGQATRVDSEIRTKDIREVEDSGTKNCRMKDHDTIGCPLPKLQNRYCREILGPDHREFTCPEKKCCSYCHKAGHKVCPYKAEDLNNCIRFDLRPFEQTGDDSTSDGTDSGMDTT